MSTTAKWPIAANAARTGKAGFIVKKYAHKRAINAFFSKTSATSGQICKIT
jgi:hypothetical protein